MPVISSSLNLSTRGHADIQDITRPVGQAILQSGLKDGVVTIFCPSSTSALTTIEFEPGVLADLKDLLSEIIPADKPYKHDAAWGDGNGYSHVRAALLGPSLSVPFSQGQLTLGTWQQIVYIDFDNRPRSRRLVLQIIGE